MIHNIYSYLLSFLFVLKQDVFTYLTLLCYHNATHVVDCVINKLDISWYLLQTYYLCCLDHTFYCS